MICGLFVRTFFRWGPNEPRHVHSSIQTLANTETPTRPNGLFAVWGTDLGTEHGVFGANKHDVVKQAGRRTTVDLNI
jgi:hypothetical protein